MFCGACCISLFNVLVALSSLASSKFECLSLHLSTMKSVNWKLCFILLYIIRTSGFQCFIFECSRVKQDDQATSDILMAASAKIGCNIFKGDIIFWAKLKIVGSRMGW